MLAHLVARASSCTSLLLAATLTTTVASAQDCWAPDRFEPNDDVAVPIGAGFHADLAVYSGTLDAQPDVDRFLVTVPAYARISIDVDVEAPEAGSSSPETLRMYGSIIDVTGSQDTAGQCDVAADPSCFGYLDNNSASAIDVEVALTQPNVVRFGCLSYDLQVTLAPRPCDVLADDPLEGPDGCVGATVLQSGLHEDLVVFNDARQAGADPDFFSVPGVQPGDWFEVRISDPITGNFDPDLRMSVVGSADCPVSPTQNDSLYVQNSTGSVQDYVVVVATEASAGYGAYDLELRSTPATSLSPDVLEPNSACAQWTPVNAGTYTDLTLTPGDSDAYEIVAPPYTSVSVRARADSTEFPIRVGMDAVPACAPMGLQSSYGFLNDTAQPVLLRARVEATGGLATRYDLEVETHIQICSATDVLRNEPDGDCATGTLIELSQLGGGTQLRAEHDLTLDDGDVDTVIVEIPAETGVIVTLERANATNSEAGEPGVEMRAYADSDCSNSPVRSLLRAIATPYSGADTDGAYLLLTNRRSAPVEYAIQFEPTDPIASCEAFELEIRGTPLSEYAGLDEYDNTSCATATPVPADSAGFDGIVGNGRAMYGVTQLRPGESVTAAVAIERHADAPFRLALFDCASGGAPFASAEVPMTPVTPQLDFLRVSHTNTTSSTQQVFVECSVEDGYAIPLHELGVSIQRENRPPYTTVCESQPSGAFPVPCPCHNHDDRAVSSGCANSTGVGAQLSASGSRSVQADDLYLHLADLPPGALGVVLEAHPSHWLQDVTFYDGLLCLHFAFPSQHVFTADANGRWDAPTPTASQADLTFLRSRFQAWYRDAAGPCGSGGNTSNAIQVDWLQ